MSKIYYRYEVMEAVNTALTQAVMDIVCNEDLTDTYRVSAAQGAYALVAEIGKELERREKEEE